MRLKAGYLFDEKIKEQINQAGQNYWWSYITEICDRLGLSAAKIASAELHENLSDMSVLFVGDSALEELSGELDNWVKNGGILIGCNTEGLDGIFGNEVDAYIEQKDGETSISGKLDLCSTALTEGIHSPLHPQKPLLIISPMRPVNPISSFLLGESDGRGIVTGRSYSDGWAFYFGFNLAQTFWVIQQGRPVDDDYDGDGYWRTMDAIVIEDNEPEIGYTDELLFLLQNMIGLIPYPLIHQVPPRAGVIPDFMIYYGGDDEGASDVQIPASNFMNDQGLPYQINIMPRADNTFGIGPEEAELLKGQRTDISLHYNFMHNYSHPGGYAESDVGFQTELFFKHFGEMPNCTVMHVFRWTGWHEPALWMSKAGIKADNSYAHHKTPPVNPVNLIGFSFGTSYPFFFYTDHNSDNERIDFLELPITAYECGYIGDKTDFTQVEKALFLADYYQLIINFFYHPIYIAKYPACRKAIKRLLSLIEEKQYTVLHAKPKEVVDWWLARSETSIYDIEFTGEGLSFTSYTPYPEGAVIKIPLDKSVPGKVNLPHRLIDKFGRRWLYLIAPAGESRIAVDFEKPISNIEPAIV